MKEILERVPHMKRKWSLIFIPIFIVCSIIWHVVEEFMENCMVPFADWCFELKDEDNQDTK